jgi:hypothetical protein
LTRVDSHYHYLFFISQAETERILRTAVEKQGGPDRARRRAGWAGAGRALPRTESGEGSAPPRGRPAGAGATRLARRLRVGPLRRGRWAHLHEEYQT